jgi:transposase
VAVVMIGVDPHKASHTAVAVGADEAVLGQVRVRASAVQAKRLLEWAAAWPERSWAVEDAGGLGHLLAQQLVAAGERVLDVQPKLAARVRLLAAEAVNKNDPGDARSVAVTALRSRTLREVAPDDHSAVLKMWARRHRDLGRSRTQTACRLHAVLCELVPGGISKEITAAHAARVLDQLTPCGAVQQARWELAADLLDDLRRADERLREVNKKLKAAVQAAGTCLTEIFGAGPVIAAAVTGEVADVSRFASRDGFAACNGTAPIEGVLGKTEGPPAVPAREPETEPRGPHDRGYPGPLPAQPGPGLLRQETGRGQDGEGGAARPQAPGQRRFLQAPEGLTQPAAPRVREGKRGTAQSPARPAHTPSASSSAKPLPDHSPPYDHNQSRRERPRHRPAEKSLQALDTKRLRSVSRSTLRAVL